METKEELPELGPGSARAPGAGGILSTGGRPPVTQPQLQAAGCSVTPACCTVPWDSSVGLKDSISSLVPSHPGDLPFSIVPLKVLVFPNVCACAYLFPD